MTSFCWPVKSWNRLVLHKPINMMKRELIQKQEATLLDLLDNCSPASAPCSSSYIGYGGGSVHPGAATQLCAGDEALKSLCPCGCSGLLGLSELSGGVAEDRRLL